MTGVYRYKGLWWAILDGRVAPSPFLTQAEARAYVIKRKGWVINLEYERAA